MSTMEERKKRAAARTFFQSRHIEICRFEFYYSVFCFFLLFLSHVRWTYVFKFLFSVSSSFFFSLLLLLLLLLLFVPVWHLICSFLYTVLVPCISFCIDAVICLHFILVFENFVFAQIFIHSSSVVFVYATKWNVFVRF